VEGIAKLPLLLRCYRAGVLLLVIVLVHQQARWLAGPTQRLHFLATGAQVFPSANRVQLRDPERGWYFVTDSRGDVIGCLLTTSPQTDHVIGYSGPTDLLIALDGRGAIVGLEILRSETRKNTSNESTRCRLSSKFLSAGSRGKHPRRKYPESPAPH